MPVCPSPKFHVMLETVPSLSVADAVNVTVRPEMLAVGQPTDGGWFAGVPPVPSW